MDYLSSKIDLALAEKEPSINHKFYLHKVCDAEHEFVESLDEHQKRI